MTTYKSSLLTVLAIVLYTGCNDVSNLNTAIEDQDSPATAAISTIDSKPIVEMSANEFYSGSSQYFKDVIEIIADNKEIVLDSYKEYVQSAQSKGITEISAPFNYIKEQPAFANSLAKSGNKDEIDNLSGHIRMLNLDNEIENFHINFSLHSPPTKRSSEVVTELMKKSKESRKSYLALDVDQFYAADGPDGEEIWPVTIPAVSLDDKEEVEITVHKDGSLKWPQSDGILAKMTASGTETDNFDGDLYYISLQSISSDPCDDPTVILPPAGCDDDGGGGGGGGSTAPSWTTEMPIFTVQYGTFLALKSLRIHERRETGSFADVLMQIQEVNQDPIITSRWRYAFDWKLGVYGRVGLLRRINFRGLFDAKFSPEKLFERIFNNQNQNSPLFDGYNTRNIAIDHTVYEVPDVNEAGVTYHFTNMRRWVSRGILVNNVGESFPTASNFEQVQTFDEIAPQNYLPLLALGETLNYRLMLHEDDTNYQHYANASQISGVAVKMMDTFDMSDGVYRNEATSIRSKTPGLFSSSDDTYGRSGVKNITLDFVEDRMSAGGGEIVAQKDNLRYVFTTVTRPVFCEPDN